MAASSAVPKRGQSQIPAWVWLLILTALAFLVRGLHLAWQPLWWDEGYSVFFATESLADMVVLTARDIHPPLYYALLHVWVGLWGSAAPVVLRSLSVLIGGLAVPVIWWVGRTLFPARPRIAVIAALLLAVSPMHLFYSQEVRMYGLEMLLGLLSTGWFVGMWTAPTPAQRNRAVVIYALVTATALYTEYYVALLPLAHFLWAAWSLRRRPIRLRPLLAADCLVALLYAPWLIYTVPRLVRYIQAKVMADNDAPLGALTYAGRHLLAFGAGHIPLPAFDFLRMAGGASLLLLLIWIGWGQARRASGGEETGYALPGSLWGLLVAGIVLPGGLGYLLNRLWPFFPEGGERVLFFLLPGVLLLAAWAVDEAGRGSGLAKVGGGAGLLLLLAAAAGGIWAFYTVPRYADDDYRPLIRQVTQQGTDADTVLAVFPWQVGFWRAYGPVHAPGGDPSLGLAPGTTGLHGPWPERLSFDAVAWDDSVAQRLDASLADGVLWLPSLLSIGSTLPQEMEAYLADGAVSVENRWFSPTTRLSAWTRPQPVDVVEVGADFGPVVLAQAGVGPTQAASANQVVQVDLAWTGSVSGLSSAGPLQASLRLQDESGRTWTQRDYGPVGMGQAGLDRMGLIVPAGLPPGEYGLWIGVRPMGTEIDGPDALAAGDLLRVDGGNERLVRVGRVTIVQPDAQVPALRLPVQHALTQPDLYDGLRLLGYSGPDGTQPLLAGTALDLTLFWQGDPGAEVGTGATAFYVAVLDGSEEVASWSGGSAWAGGPGDIGSGVVAQVPVQVQLSGYTATGRYDLVAGLVRADGSRTPPTRLGQVSVVRRTASFDPVEPEHSFLPPLRFGTHVQMLGYDLVQKNDGGESVLDLTLYWQVEQPLLPPHQLFVHVDSPDGARLAQADGTPNHEGEDAPTGSWQPGERLTHRQQIRLPVEATHPGQELIVRVGLYVPDTGVRLPVSQAGVVLGDSVVLGE